MARTKRRAKKRPDDRKGGGRYTPAELFIALIGLGVLVLIAGMIVSEFLE